MSSSAPARWLPLDKAADFTSHDLVALARKRLGLRRIGHTGTLDPDATGVLVLAMGKATRLIQYLPGGKSYRAVIRLGLETDSYDASGQVLAEAPVPELTLAELEALLEDFSGPQQQIPPMVSAISIQGQRLYQLARQGIEVERPPRAVHFYRLDVLKWESPYLEIDIDCSAGTYIRSLAHDLGARLGCGGSLAQLRRTRAHGFGLGQTLRLEALQALSEAPEPGLAADWPLQALPALTLPDQAAVLRLRQGQPVADTDLPEDELLRIYSPEGEFAALGQSRAGAVWPKLLLLDPVLSKQT